MNESINDRQMVDGAARFPMETSKRFGEQDEATPSLLFWIDNGTPKHGTFFKVIGKVQNPRSKSSADPGRHSSQQRPGGFVLRKAKNTKKHKETMKSNIDRDTNKYKSCVSHLLFKASGIIVVCVDVAPTCTELELFRDHWLTKDMVL